MCVLSFLGYSCNKTNLNNNICSMSETLQASILFSRLPRNLFPLSQMFLNNLTGNNNNVPQEQRRSASLHTILAFIIPVLVDLIEVKCQGTSQSPFETHPTTITIAIANLLAYCIAFGVDSAYPPHLPRPADARMCQAIMALFGSFALVSLASTLLPDPALPVLYVIYTLLLVGELYVLVQKLCHWIHRQLVNATFRVLHLRARRRHIRRGAPLLPLTLADAHFVPPMNDVAG